MSQNYECLFLTEGNNMTNPKLNEALEKSKTQSQQEPAKSQNPDELNSDDLEDVSGGVTAPGTECTTMGNCAGKAMA
jgi:hypothetical protein